MHTNLTGLEYELYDYKQRRKSRGWKAVICFAIWLILALMAKESLHMRDKDLFIASVLALETVGTLAFLLSFVFLFMYGSANRHVKKINKFINMQRGAQVEKDNA